MLSFYEIDQYSFSPGPHTLTIAFVVSTGEQGEFVYEFTGLIRERMLILIVSLSSLPPWEFINVIFACYSCCVWISL